MSLAKAHLGHGATFDTDVRQDAIGEFWGQFPKGEGEGGGHLRARAGGECTIANRYVPLGCGFYELFLA
jgi:hypothetical protein